MEGGPGVTDPMSGEMVHTLTVSAVRRAKKDQGALKKRSQLRTKMAGKDRWTKRDKTSGAFMATKKSKKKFKGVRREKA